MKKKILLLMGIFSIGVALHAQVGVNTQNPQGVFHIDIKGNTNGATNISDDIIINSDGGTGGNLSMGGVPVPSTSIALHSSNKGFIPNRVSLLSDIDVTTVASPISGMVVYNIEPSGSFPNAVIPGFYMYTGTRWERLRTGRYIPSNKSLLLQNNVTSTAHTTTGNAPALDFGKLIIYEDGAYTFSFNLSATSSTGALSSAVTRGVIYLYAFKKGLNDSDFSLLDYIEINPPLFANGASFNTTAFLALALQAGDEMQFRIHHNVNYPSITYVSGEGRTFLTYWML